MSTVTKIEKNPNFRLVPGVKLPRAFTSNCVPNFTQPNNRIFAFAGHLPSVCISGEELPKGITHAMPRTNPLSAIPDPQKYATDPDSWAGGGFTPKDGYWLNGEATRPPWANHGTAVANPLTTTSLAVTAANAFVNGYSGWGMKLMDFEFVQGQQPNFQGKQNLRAIFQQAKAVNPNVMMGAHHIQAYRVWRDFYNPQTSGYDPSFWNLHYNKTKAEIENIIREDLYNSLFRTSGGVNVSDFIEVSSVNAYEMRIGSTSVYQLIQSCEIGKKLWPTNANGKKINHLITIEGFMEITAGEPQNQTLLSSFKLPNGTAKTLTGEWQTYPPSLFAQMATISIFYADGMCFFGGFSRSTELPQYYYDQNTFGANSDFGIGPNFSYSIHHYKQHQDVTFDFFERMSRYKPFFENTETINRPEIFEGGVWKTGDALLPASRHQAKGTHVGMRIVGNQALILCNDMFNEPGSEKTVKCRFTGWGEFDIVVRGQYPTIVLLNQ
jgi:hypothetical protein